MREEGLKEGLRKSFLVGAVVVLLLVLCPTLIGIGVTAIFGDYAQAASTCNIDITATGSEVDITCNQTLWAIGVVHNSDTANTGSDNTWGAVTNGGSEAVDLTVYGNDMVGSSGNWTLDSTATPGAATIGMKISVPGDSDYIIKKEGATPYVTWADGLASSANQTFSLYFWAPTSGTGNEAMTMCDGEGANDGGPYGVVITGSVDV